MLEELGINAYINAHDTYTIYGGSRMEKETLKAMEEISRIFVDMGELQRILGNRIAELTENEGAYITNGAAGGLVLAAAVCMAGDDMYAYRKLPDSSGLKNEVIIQRCQRNAYDKAVESSGAVVVEIGDADETLEFELEGAINEKTAAVFYFVSSSYERASLPLETVIRIANKRGIPVVVDAAAQLPPAENLYRFTKMGADMVLFSGGKTLRGPQDSGLILGRKEMIERCRRFGAPEHGICRSCKVSREAMAGLYTAVKIFVEKDHQEEQKRLMETAVHIKNAFHGKYGIQAEIIEQGPVGQKYPRVFLHLPNSEDAGAVWKSMKKRHIYIGTEMNNSIYISPLNLSGSEADTVIDALGQCLSGSRE